MCVCVCVCVCVGGWVGGWVGACVRTCVCGGGGCVHVGVCVCVCVTLLDPSYRFRLDSVDLAATTGVLNHMVSPQI